MRILIIYFFSVKLLHCITPLSMVTSTFASFSSLWARTSMQKIPGATPAPLMSLKRCSEWFIHCLLFSLLTALQHSSGNGHTDVCKLLVAARADVDAKNRCQQPLVAVSPPSPSAATPHLLRCRWGETALRRAIDRNRADVVAYLQSVGPLDAAA